jgi:post-segregation antitoxin (ccd killing protein)
MEKVITLPEPLLQQASETARQKGIEVDALVIEAVERYLEEQREEPVSEAWKELRKLLQHKKKTINFMKEVHQARAWAREVEEANQDVADLISAYTPEEFLVLPSRAEDDNTAGEKGGS